MQAQVKRRLLAPIFKRSPKLFNLWMHNFAARRILGTKEHAVHELLEEGVMSKGDTELVQPLLEAMRQRGGVIGFEMYDMWNPPEAAVCDEKTSLTELVASMRESRKQEGESRTQPRKSVYHYIYPGSEGLVTVADSATPAPEAGFQSAPEEKASA
jgi:hypothetical protein